MLRRLLDDLDCGIVPLPRPRRTPAFIDVALEQRAKLGDDLRMLGGDGNDAGGANAKPRAAIVHHSVNGNFAIRQGMWKLALCAGSGGWSDPREPAAARQKLPPMQLYDLSRDPAETTNLASKHPQVVAELRALLQRYVDDGRSTPGPRQRNDAAVEIVKKPSEQPASTPRRSPES